LLTDGDENQFVFLKCTGMFKIYSFAKLYFHKPSAVITAAFWPVHACVVAHRCKFHVEANLGQEFT